jgi:hypothetical protein
MSEDPVEYNKERGELRFVRLRSLPDDLIGYVTYHDEYIVIETPLRIEIETIFEEGRQILAMQEYLPQSVIEMREVEFYSDEVLFTSPVRKEFYEQYEYVSDFFYNNTHNLTNNKKKKGKKEAQDKVVSILEAMANKKDKPVH